GSSFDKANPYAGGWRYLEIMNLVTNSTASWGRSGVYYGATRSGIGEGRINMAILKDHTDAVSAVGRCRAYTGGGFSDWYLPTTGELNDAYSKSALLSGGHWSSEEQNATTIYNSANGTTNTYTKTGTNNVSAVRSFAGSEPTKMVAYVTVPAEIQSTNGGSVPSSPQLYPVGQSVPVLGNIGGLTHIADFSFMGWSTRPGGRGTTYLPGTTLPVDSGDVVLYPRWQVPGYDTLDFAKVTALTGAATAAPVDNSDANRLMVNDILVYKLNNGNVGKIRIDNADYGSNHGLQFYWQEWTSGGVDVGNNSAVIEGTAYWNRDGTNVFHLQNFTGTERAIVMENGSIIYYLGQ
ncbi:MAG TPA: hypothetical protein PKH81_06915, partial [Treponemataceae bacterium]|nr:hypothetical protein [Treponemataceae bacterium]